MKDEKEIENKRMTDKPNKTGMTRIRINHNRAIAGLGKAGEEFDVSELVANNFVAQGLAVIVNAPLTQAEDASVDLADENNHIDEEK